MRVEYHLFDSMLLYADTPLFYVVRLIVHELVLKLCPSLFLLPLTTLTLRHSLKNESHEDVNFTFVLSERISKINKIEVLMAFQETHSFWLTHWNQYCLSYINHGFRVFYVMLPFMVKHHIHYVKSVVQHATYPCKII